MCPDWSVLLLHPVDVLFVGYFSEGCCCSDGKSPKVLNLVTDSWEKVVVMRAWNRGENGLQEKLTEEVEVCLLLCVPVCRTALGALAVAAVPGQTKFSRSCAKSK